LTSQIGKSPDIDDINPDAGFMSGQSDIQGQQAENPGTDTWMALLWDFCN